MWYDIQVDDDDIICLANCIDCDTFIIIDAECISIFEVVGAYTAATVCVYCESPVTGDISDELVAELVVKGVRVLQWETND